jgi:ATP-dependent RNA helicase RhlE
MNSKPVENFFGLGIAPGLLEVIAKLGFKVPTPIQFKAIPIASEGRDVIGIAQTGTGKTIAFGLPMIQRLAQTKGRGLILVPTRELALQVDEALKPFTSASGMWTAVLIGGESQFHQIRALQKNPRIIIATPGRLLDFLMAHRLRLDDVSALVLDEADRMLDMGFAPQIEKILKVVPRERQTMLFSATMPARIVQIASAHMKLPVRTEIAPSGTAAKDITQEIFFVKKDLKGALLIKLLEQYRGPVLLFTRTKRGAKKVTSFLRVMKHNAAEIHSDRTLEQRRAALDGFKSGRFRVLVATDIAARGIDVTGIEVVINYDLPDDPENYVHRIGRTGRAGAQGRAISIATPEQKSDVRAIENLMRTTIPQSQHPHLPQISLPMMAEEPVRKFQRPRGGFQPPRRRFHR